jgi:hypothetical protein
MSRDDKEPQYTALMLVTSKEELHQCACISDNNADCKVMRSFFSLNHH